MYKPDDKDIDRLSRDAAEHYHAPGKPAWDALQQILDKELPQEKEKKRRGFFFFFLLLGITVAGSGIWYGLGKINHANKVIAGTGKTTTQNKTGNQSAETPVDASKSGSGNTVVPDVKTVPAGGALKNQVSPADSKKTDYAEKNKTGSTVTNIPATTAGKPAGNSNNAPKADGKTKGDAVVANTQEKVSDPVKNNTAGDAITGKKNYRQKLYNGKTNNPNEDALASTGEKVLGSVKDKSPYTATDTQKKHHQKSSSNDLSLDLANENKGNPKKNAVANSADGNTDAVATTDLAAGDYNADKTKQNNLLTDKKDIPAVTTAQDAATDKRINQRPVLPDSQVLKTKKNDSSAIAAKKKAKSKNEKAINIGLTAGLDLSTVRFTYGDNAGYNLGITGGYQFSKHWSVYTGIIYTKKNYKLNGSDYHPPKHYWTQYVTLQTVDGYCRMWEVPLLARYTFNPGSKTAYFASAGISSYFMKKQAYNYSYKDMTGWPGTASWTNDSSFNHVFSILSLSAGFEKNFGKHMNWQIEPYAKIPLGGVGFGNIKLSSFGVNLTVQYRHPVKR